MRDYKQALDMKSIYFLVVTFVRTSDVRLNF